MKKIRLATVFSGIGSIEYAFKRLGIPHDIVFACDNGEVEIDYDKNSEMRNVKMLSSPKLKMLYVDKLYSTKTRKHNFVKDTYMANYSIENDFFFQDINLLDGRDFHGKVDLLVGGSPCQSFSSVGYKEGLASTRGTLFFEFARLIKEIQPIAFIYENVRNMLKHDRGKTWEIIKASFDELGYNLDFKVLNAVNFNIPQNRNRLFVVGYKKSFNKQPNILEHLILPHGKPYCEYCMQDFLLNNCSFGNFIYDKKGNLIVHKDKGTNIEKKYYLSNAVKNYVLKGGTKNWYQKPEIDLQIARTLLKTMGNCHRAGVDNYITDNGKLRMLTEREALRLMGYADDFVVPVSSCQVYKQAGNSIVVDVMMSILKTIINDKILN